MKTFHLYKRKKHIPGMGVILGIIIFAVVLVYFNLQISGVKQKMDNSDVTMLKDALENAIVTCYAIEGAYPESLEYIEEHYGVIIDRDKFYVDYQAVLSNVKPDLQVYTISR